MQFIKRGEAMPGADTYPTALDLLLSTSFAAVSMSDRRPRGGLRIED